MKKLSTLFLFVLSFSLTAQTIADFENFGLEVDQFDNDASPGTHFESGNVLLPNNYVDDPMFPFWTGWSISTSTDVTTEGFTNQYSSISGGGYDGSLGFAVGTAFSALELELNDLAKGNPVAGMYINNGTYPYLSMLNGDSFAKRFGGEDGTDPDFFLLTISGIVDGIPTSNNVEFYLADYRFDNSEEDYIINEWTFVDLSSLGDVNGLSFSLTSSDNNQFGMLTPAFFLADNITTMDDLTSTEDLVKATNFKISPNPASDFINIEWIQESSAPFSITGIDGRSINQGEVHFGDNQIEIANLVNGIYFVKIGSQVQRLIKQSK